MVDVQHRTLCSFCQHTLSLAQSLVYLNLSIHKWERAHIFHTLHPQSFLLGDVIVGIMKIAQRFLMTCLQGAVLLFKVLFNVAHAQSRTTCFLAIGRANAFSRCPYFVLSLGCLIGTVKHTMCGQDEMRTTTDVQTTTQIIASLLQFLRLSHEQVWGNDASITDDIQFSFIKDARRNASQHEFLTFKDNCVASIGTTSKACYNIILRGKVVNHFTLSFVSKHNAQQGIHFSFCHNMF